MFQFRIRPAAYADMDAIADFIRRDNPERAESFSEELAQKIETVAERPLSFPARAEFGRTIRSALHGNYLILFRFENEEVEIVRVLHGARDIEGLF
jgi:toxin ParE1/3/4